MTDLARIVRDGMERSQQVEEWPADEADIYRNQNFKSFSEREEYLQNYRAEKVVAAIRKQIAAKIEEERDRWLALDPDLPRPLHSEGWLVERTFDCSARIALQEEE